MKDNSLEHYYIVRPRIMTGDIIQWKGHGIFSRLIRLFSRYSHTSLVIKMDRYEWGKDRVWILEAVNGGIQLNLLSKRLAEYNGEAFHVHSNIEPEHRSIIAGWGLAQVGIKYDFKSLFRNLFGRVSVDATKYFCSEFVFYAWKRAGLVGGDIAPRPGDLNFSFTGEPLRLIRGNYETI